MNIIEFLNKMPLLSNEEILNYLNNRIRNREVCTKEELLYLDKIINNFISDISLENKNKNKILYRLSDLYIMSVNMSDYNIIKSKRFFYYNSEDVIDYLTILLKDCPNIFGLDLLYKLLYKYLNTYGDINELINIFNKYKDKIGVYKTNLYIDYINKSSFTIICNNILKELDNDVICADTIINNLDVLSNINLNYHSPKRISLLKDVLNKINLKNNLDSFTKEDFDIIIDKVNNIFMQIDKDYKKNEQIRNNIENGTINIKRTHPYIENLNYPKDDYRIVQNEKIITINKNNYNKNAAFSMRKEYGNYILRVYITDVPTFLSNNRQLAINAYNRGENMYLKSKDRTLLIPMLPLFLTKKNLSLNMNFNKNALEFTFVIDRDGKILSRSVDKKFFKIGNDLTVEDAKRIINNEEDSLLRYCLRNYSDLCKIIAYSNKNNINEINANSDNVLVKLPLKLIDDYVSSELNFGIYRDKKMYTKENTGDLNASTPLSNYSCNINLALFLEDNGIHICDEKDLCYVEDHIDEIINHLNDRKDVKEFVINNYDFCKKYVI